MQTMRYSYIQYLVLFFLWSSIINTTHHIYEPATMKQRVHRYVQKFNQYGYVYVPLSIIFPGQLRYSQKNVDQKVAAAYKKGFVKKENGTTFSFDRNKSILPPQAALPVIWGPDGFRLVDGHHDYLSSRAVGAQTIPIKIVEDMHTMKPRDFWREAIAKNYIYPYTLQGEKIIPLPKDWNALKDDPNRYFAAISARKCPNPIEQPDETTGADYPLWVKVGKGIPFIEFKMSDKLMAAGIFYQNDMGDDLTQEPLASLVEQARKVLKENPISGLKLVPDRMYYKNINGGNICEYGSSK